jgi:hypothetical protein
MDEKERVVKRLSGEKIVICPLCKADLKYLDCYSEVRREFTINENGDPDYSDEDYDNEGRYECPHCMEELTDDELDAIDILKGNFKIENNSNSNI